VAQTEKTTTIDIVVVEHDGLTPTPKPDIYETHEATVVLHIDKRMDEIFQNVDVTNPRMMIRRSALRIAPRMMAARFGAC